MHRSGTSAVAGALSKLGAALPKKTLMGPHECNERGLFESFALACVHDELLMAAGSRWHDWQPIDPQWMKSAAAHRYGQTIKAVIVDEFEDEKVIVLKDPRICRFVPFMQSILAELAYRCVAILPVRNPIEVALSLRRRNGFGPAKSILLWMRHVLDAEHYSRNMPRCFLSYETFVRDWRPHLDRIATSLGVVWPDLSDASCNKIEQFLTEELHHQRVLPDKIAGQVSPLAMDVYAILTKIISDRESDELRVRLDNVRERFDEGCRTFGSAIAAEELVFADKALLAERDSLAAALDKLRSEYDALLATQ